jgi:hypothetical protein
MSEVEEKPMSAYQRFEQSIMKIAVNWVKEGGIVQRKNDFTEEELCEVVFQIAYTLKNNEDALKYIMLTTKMIKDGKITLGIKDK